MTLMMRGTLLTEGVRSTWAEEPNRMIGRGKGGRKGISNLTENQKSQPMPSAVDTGKMQPSEILWAKQPQKKKEKHENQVKLSLALFPPLYTSHPSSLWSESNAIAKLFYRGMGQRGKRHFGLRLRILRIEGQVKRLKRFWRLCKAKTKRERDIEREWERESAF